MAALTISGNPTLVSGPTEVKQSGGTIAAWDAVYLDSNGEVQKANGGASGTATVYGVALNAAANNGQVVVAKDRAIVTSSAADFTAGLVCYLDDGTAGAVTTTEADIASSSYKSLVFFPLSTTQVQVYLSTAVEKA